MGICGEFPELFFVAHPILDGATKAGSHQFLRIIPNSGASQSHQTIRRECFAIWTTGGIHWDCYRSKPRQYCVKTDLLTNKTARTEINKESFQYSADAI